MNDLKLTSLLSMSEGIEVFVCFQSFHLASVNVMRSQSISILRNLIQFDLNGRNFWFNEQILEENLSFAYYGVKDQDLLLALDGEQNDNTLAFWRKFVNTFLKDKIKILKSESMLIEFNRLHDIGMNKLETKPREYNRHYGKMSKRIEQRKLGKGDCNQLVTNIPKPKKPSKDPLPCFWQQE